MRKKTKPWQAGTVFCCKISHLQLTTPSRLFNGDTVLPSDNNSRCHSRENTVVNNADRLLQLFRHELNVLNLRLEVEVDDVVSVVGDGDLVTVTLVIGGGAHPQDRLRTLAALMKMKMGCMSEQGNERKQ